MDSTKNIMKHKVLWGIALVLFIIPFLLWGNSYLVGGDDTKLYYVFPEAFLENYAFNVATDNTLGGAMTGYAPVSYFAPFFYLILFFKHIPILNVQMMMLGANLSLGFLFFYFFSTALLPAKSKFDYYIHVVGSLFYVTSVYLVNTLYSHQLISIYLVSMIPACLYFFHMSLKNNSVRYSVLAALIFSLGSTTLNTFPWWGAFGITVVPLLLSLILKNISNAFKSITSFTVTMLFLNLHWLFI